jgi:uncharacterized protein YndB with AHSA1/START domain
MTTLATPEAVRLEMRRTFAAARPRVFDAWIQPEMISQWMGCSDSKVIEAKTDPRAGGKYTIRMGTTQYGEVELTGTYREFVRPSRLAFSWQWSGDGHETQVSIDFIEKGPASTEIRLVHEGFLAAESRDNHTRGWTTSLERLATLLAASAS